MSEIVLVTGGRDYGDAKAVHRTLWELRDMRILVHGGASGADRLCAAWAAKHGVHAAEVRALWDWFGKAAGPRRNEAMLILRPDLLVAFPGGRGTAHMVETAKRHGIPIIHAQKEPTDGRG